MTERTGSPPDAERMQRERLQWHSEHVAWIRDITLWQREQKLAEALLYQLEHALPDHRQRMLEHSDDIAGHEKRLREYERLLSESVPEGQAGGNRLEDLVAAHRQQAQHHEHEREQHDAFRSQHRAAMAEFRRITKLIEQIDREA
jgi:hypothetical protein